MDSSNIKQAVTVEIPIVKAAMPVTTSNPASLDVTPVTPPSSTVTVERPGVSFSSEVPSITGVTSGIHEEPSTIDVTSVVTVKPAVLKEAINNVVDKLPVIANETVKVGIIKDQRIDRELSKLRLLQVKRLMTIRTY